MAALCCAVMSVRGQAQTQQAVQALARAKQLQAQAALLLTQGRPSQALRLLDEAIALDASLSAAHADRGVALVQLGDSVAAEISFKRALDYDPQDLGTLENLANLLILFRHHDEAREVALRVASIGAAVGSSQVLVTAGTIMSQLGDDSSALATFTQATVMSKVDLRAYLQASLLLIRNGRCADAMTYMRKAVELRPDFANVWGGMGYCSFVAGSYAEAVAFWDKAGAIRPTFMNDNPGYARYYDQARHALQSR